MGGALMTHRKNVEIKTKYRSVEECIDNCRDIKKRLTLPVPAWIYTLFIWKSDSLYHDLIRKVQED